MLCLMMSNSLKVLKDKRNDWERRLKNIYCHLTSAVQWCKNMFAIVHVTSLHVHIKFILELLVLFMCYF